MSASECTTRSSNVEMTNVEREMSESEVSLNRKQFLLTSGKKDSLIEFCYIQHKALYLYLFLTCCIWPAKGYSCVFNVLSFVYCFLISALLIYFQIIKATYTFDNAIKWQNIFLFFAQFLQIIVLVPNIRDVHLRLSKSVQEYQYDDIFHNKNHFRHITLFICVNIIFSTLYAIIAPPFVVFGVLSNTTNAVSNVIITCLISACLSFTVADIRTARCLVTENVQAAQQRTLTIEQLNITRGAIKKQVASTYNSMSMLLTVAAIDMIAFLIKVFLPSDTGPLGSVFAACGGYLNEVIFLLICCFESAFVHQEADKLVTTLGFAN